MRTLEPRSDRQVLMDLVGAWHLGFGIVGVIIWVALRV